MKLKTIVITSLSVILSIFVFNEFLIYYLTLSKCIWPILDKKNNDKIVNAMILADPHLLGPFRGHWIDKLRREWQMHRAFQSAMTLFRPEVVFILGDIFDEGNWVNQNQFSAYAERFHRLFLAPNGTKVISIVGNHDVGFHYSMHPILIDRFEKQFNNTGVELYTIKDVHFIVINSMAMENDNCYFCENANNEIINISDAMNCAKNSATCNTKNNRNLIYSQPIIMQHFPTYRKSDDECIEHDSPKIERYREKWEVLSKEATDLIGNLLNPRVAFSGHSHHFCRLKNRLNIEEYTISSFSWRNKNRPSFLLSKFTPESYAISICYVPQESTVFLIYYVAAIGLFLYVFLAFCHHNYTNQITLNEYEMKYHNL